MNAKKMKAQKEIDLEKCLVLIPLEKATKPSLWSKFKTAMAKPDMNIAQWEYLEKKRCRPPSDFDRMGRS